MEAVVHQPVEAPPQTLVSNRFKERCGWKLSIHPLWKTETRSYFRVNYQDKYDHNKIESYFVEVFENEVKVSQ